MKKFIVFITLGILLVLSGCSKGFTVTIKGFDGKVISQNKYTKPVVIEEPEVEEVEDYIFEGWFVGGSEFDFTKEISKDTVIEAFYSEDERYKITFVDTDGTVIKEVRVEEGASIMPPTMQNRFGYRFDGWNPSNAYRNVASDATIKAVYTPVYGTATFYDIDGNVFESIYYGGTDTFTPPTAPEVKDYTFIKWDIDFSIACGDIKVYPIYEKNIYIYKINYHMENHSWGYTELADLKEDFLADLKAFSGSNSITNNAKFLYNEDVNAKHSDYFLNNPIYKEKYASLVNEVGAIKTTNMNWAEAFNNYFSNPASKLPTIKQNVKAEFLVGDYFVLPVVYEHGFIGWYLNDNFSGSAVTILETSKYEEANLYPRFTESETYTISFNSDCGNLINPISIEYGQKVTLPTPFKSGYKFLYWQNGNDKYEGEFTFMENESIALKAVYEADTTSLKSNGDLVKDFNGDTIQMPNTYVQRDEEMRAVWVTSYVGDFAPSTSEQTMKNTLNKILDNMEAMNLNTIIFHIRVTNDAYYRTKLAPINSSYGTYDSFGKWDYLTWFIEECHKRGIEFHAWLNPYRISASGYTADTTPEDVAAKYKNYPDNPASDSKNILMTYVDGSSAGAILDPGSKEVREYIIKTCLEVMENYDVDAIHFDDYFYARMSANIDVLDEPDQATYEAYIDANPGCGLSKTSTANKSDWRREQVNIFIKDLHDAMVAFNQKTGRTVELGISPTGIYSNGKGTVTYKEDGTAVSNGSATRGQTHYSSYLFCDTKKWIDNEWIDYILPQTYWSFGQNVACYANIVDWWSKIVKNKNVKLYVGMGLYMSLQDGKYTWSSDSLEAYNQVLYANKYQEVKGFSIFSYKSLVSVMSNEKSTAYEGVMKIRDELWTKKVAYPEN